MDGEGLDKEEQAETDLFTHAAQTAFHGSQVEFDELTPDQQKENLLQLLKQQKVGYSDSNFSEFQKFIMRQAEETRQ